MILELDAGNSQVKWRCGEQRGRLATEALLQRAFPSAWESLAIDTLRLASVADQEVATALAEWAASRPGARLRIAASSAYCAGVSNSYADPSRMGVDRWLAMLAGFKHAAGACCVVDCGSAITVDYVAADGRHLGGYIMPGLRLMRLGLLGNTRQIRVEHELAPATAPGRSTEEAVQHGLQLMVAALAERVVKDSRQLLGDAAPLLICGGDGALFQQAAGCGLLLPELVLDGLALALPEDHGCAG